MPKVELLNCDCMDYMRGLEDNAFDLIIVDPPYFGVKGKFDFVWEDFESYLTDVDLWAAELARVLKRNGSLYWYGHAKKISYSQVIIDKYLNLENSLVWFKSDSQTNKGIDEFRSYAPVTERILFYSKEIERTGLEMIMEEHIKPVHPFALYLRDEFKRAGVSAKVIAGLFKSKTGGLTGCVSNWLNGDNVITEEQYLKVRQYLNNEYLRKEYEYLRKEYEDLRKEYEDLRKEYEDQRRPFNNILRLTDVMRFSQEGHITGRHNHPTQKPPKLSEAIIRTSGKPGGRAFIPFMGSGTEAIECYKFGMDVSGCELDNDYYDAACKRFDHETAQQAMF